jgi:hypothetical protein
MGRTKTKAGEEMYGNAFVVRDLPGHGPQLIVGTVEDYGGPSLVANPITLATTKRQATRVAEALLRLAEELPD